MILLRLQTITSCKTKTSITDICLLFSLQVKPSLADRGVWNSKNGENRTLSNNKVSAKDVTPEDTLALNCHKTLLIHLIQPHLTRFCSLNSNHTLLVASFETISVVEEYWGGGGGGGQGAIFFLEGIAMHEHGLTMCIDFKGDYIKRWRKAVLIVQPLVGEG